MSGAGECLTRRRLRTFQGSTPRAHREPAEETREQWNRDGGHERPAAARARSSEEAGHDEQADGIENEECADEACDYRENATQRSLLESMAAFFSSTK